MKKPIPEVDPAAIDALARYPWPGNVRELENMVERAMILCSGAPLTARDFHCPQREERPAVSAGGLTLEELERELIQRTLVQLDWNKTVVARRLGISRRALYDKAHRLGIALDPRDLP
jgi:DNA-binding NtrC family response regulator